MKLIKTLLQKWHKFYGESRHQQLLALAILLVIGAAIPLTINLEIHNTDNRQDAASKITWCDSGATQSTVTNGLGVCGNQGWGRCEPSKSDCGAGTWDPQTGGGACRGYDKYSGCCYPKYIPSFTTWTCGSGGFGFCATQNTCSSDNGGANFKFSWNGSDGICSSLAVPPYHMGCCYPQGLDYPSRKSDAVCSTGSSQCTNQDKSYNECEYASNPNYCEQKIGPNHLVHVTHDSCGWHCQDLGKPAGQCGNSGGAPTDTPTPTNSPTPTNTPTPKGPSKVKLILGLPAIGGKNGGNGNPHRYVRNIKIYFYNKDDDPTDPAVEPVAIKPGKVQLDKTVGSLTYGSFVSFPSGGIDIGKFEGTYKVLVKSDGYLRKQFIPKSGDNSQTYTFTGGETTSLPKITLIAGDIFPVATPGNDTGDNVLDISDYNLLVRDCYGNKNSCPDKTTADLNDDGKIDGIDYNILIRSFKIMADEGSQGGDGE